MKHPLLILLPSLALAATTYAGGPASKPGAATADPAGPAHKSVFLASPNDHNPFWPIGWVKSATVAAPDAPIPQMPHAEDFLVTTILLNDPPMAVINGKEMAQGEIQSFPINGQDTVVQLMAVQDGRVILRWQNQNIVVTIHRDENLSGTYTGEAATAALR